jgi:ABC-2 type transport system permease protein
MSTHLSLSQAAVPPYRPQHRSPITRLQQYATIFRMLLAEYRRTWFFHLIRSLLFPVAFVFLVKMTLVSTSREQSVFLLGGLLTTALAFGSLSTLIDKIGWSRQRHELDYWTTLPIPKLAFILALMSVCQLFALPGLLGAYLLGSIILAMPPSGLIILPLLLLLPLSSLPLAGLAAFLGSYAPNGPLANMIGNVMTIVIGFLSPMYLPLRALPLPLRILAQFMPLTYSADAFRSILNGSGTNLLIDILILCIFALLFLLLVHHKLDWRAS